MPAEPVVSIQSVSAQVPDAHLYEEIFRGSNEGIGVLGPDGRYVVQNEAHRRLLGYSDEELRGQTPALHLGAEAFARVAQRLAEEGVFQGEVASRTKEGRPLGLHLSAFTVRDAAGRPQAFVGIKRDLTLLKATQAELAGRAEQLHALHELSLRVQVAHDEQTIHDAALDCLMHTLRADRAAILLYAEDGVMRFRAWRGLSDAYRATVEGHSPWPRDAADPQPVVVHDGLVDVALAPYHDLFRREGIRGLAFVPLVHQGRLLGKFMVYLDTPRGFRGGDIHLAQTVASSVAFAIARTRAERELRASRERLELAQEVAHVGHWDWDARRDEAQLSDELLRICGRARADVPATLEGFLSCVHPDDRPALAQAAAAALASGQVFETVHRIGRPDGSVRWVRARGTPRGENGPGHADGAAVRILTTVLDITDIRRAEEDRMEGLRKSQELASLQAMDESKGRFISLAAHELRTPLGPMKAELAMLKQATPGMDSEQRQSFEAIERNLRRMSRFVDDLLHVARMQTGRFHLDRQPLDLAQPLQEAVRAYQPAAAQGGITLEVAQMQEAQVDGDPHRLGQVFANLLSNAVKVTGPGGRITVALERVDGRARVSVRDTGVGLRAQDLPRLFEPFSQAHAATLQGTGLGLYICRSIVELHGGRIWCESGGAGQGACFAFELPLLSAGAGVRVGPDAGFLALEGEHVVHLYHEEAELVGTVCRYALGALQGGQPVLFFATRAHGDVFRRALAGHEVDVAQATQEGRLTFVAVEDVLPQILVDGRPDAARFEGLVRDLLERGRVAGRRHHVHVFGEIVDVLWRDGQGEATLLLEELWNGLRRTVPFTLYCAYHVEAGAQLAADLGAMQGVLCAHSALVRARWGPGGTDLASAGDHPSAADGPRGVLIEVARLEQGGAARLAAAVQGLVVATETVRPDAQP